MRDVRSCVTRELLPDGRVGEVGMIAVNDRHCPYSYAGCDLWREMTEDSPSQGRIPDQIEQALADLPKVDAVKLCNAGNFFDEAFISDAERRRIADLCSAYRWVMIESRPELVDDCAVCFARLLQGRLEIGMGLETVEATIPALLNGPAALADFERAARFMAYHGVALRALVMVKPPFVSEVRALELTIQNIDYAVMLGAKTVALIPTRSSPGAMEWLEAERFFAPPSLWTLYHAAAHGAGVETANVLVDARDLHRLTSCSDCLGAFEAAFRTLNVTQHLPAVACSCSSSYDRILATESIRGAEEYASLLKNMRVGSAAVGQIPSPAMRR